MPDVIHSVEELLRAFLAKEQAALDKHEITHAPTIGDMYEGLAREVLARAIPESADLRVVSGFARGAKGKLSRQLDCMLVTGLGEQIPFTDNWTYDLQQVVAVIEVKKTLYGTQVAEGHDNLASVLDADPSANVALPNLHRHAFESITRCSYPSDPAKLEAIDPQLDMLWHLLRVESAVPVRVLLGFHGYASLTTLATGVLDHLESRLGILGNGPMSWPHLIANARGAVVKANGMPWGVPIDDGFWHALLLLDAQPVYPLLELVWSRLNYMGKLDAAAFGDDRTLDEVRPLAKVRFDPAKRAWHVEALRPEAASTPPPARPATRAWTPAVVTETEHEVIVHLCDADLDLDALPRTLPSRDAVLADLERLRSHGLAGPDPTRPTTWRLLTEGLNAARLPDGRFVAAENSTGRLTRWINDEIARLRR